MLPSLALQPSWQPHSSPTGPAALHAAPLLQPGWRPARQPHRRRRHAQPPQAKMHVPTGDT